MPVLSLTSLGAASFIIGGVAFLLLTALLASSWRGRARGALLVAASALNSVWCFVLAYALLLGVSALFAVLLETARDAGFLIFAAWMLPKARFGRIATGARLSAVLLPLAIATWIALQQFAGGSSVVHHGLPSAFVYGAICLSLLGLMLVEQLFRSAYREKRWAIKYLCLALATLFAYDFVLYSSALLYHRIGLAFWDTRGAINALVVPLIAVSAARNPTWSLDVHVSRRAAFQTSALIVTGGYLLIMAIGGYYIRSYGGTWGKFAQIVIVVAAALILLVMLFSGQVRARARIFITKHFFNYKYDYREEWLRLTRGLNDVEAGSDPYEQSIKAVALILDSPGGALWLARERAYVCTARWNAKVDEEAVEPCDSALAAFLQEWRWIIDLQEYEQNPKHYGHLALPAWLLAIPRAWLVVPLLSRDELLGFMVFEAPRAAYELSWEDRDLLKTASTQTGGFLAQLESRQSLAEARQFQAFNRLSAFIMHDLKNLLAQQSLLVENAEKHKTNPDFIDDMVATIDHSVKRMNRLLGHLRQERTPGETRRVMAGPMLRSTVADCSDREPVPVLECDRDEATVMVQPEELAMVIGHIVRNAQDATRPDGRVTIRASSGNDILRVEIEDDGMGMDPEFVREHLFQPFYTTKASRGMGIGAYQARTFIRTAGGDVVVRSQPGKGTLFTLTLPTVQPVEAKAAALPGA